MRYARTLVASSVVAVAALGLGACSGPSVVAEPASLSIAIPPSQFFATFEPNAAFGLFFTPSQAVYDPLVRQNPETKVYEPWLAEQFEVSEDGLTLSITLRDDVVFSDGEQLTAQGVADTINHYFYVETGYFFAISGPYAPHAEATGELTLDVTTAQPIYSDGLFMQLLSLFPIVSPAAYLDAESLLTTPVGSGPYLLDEVIPEVSASFVRNPDYWNPEAYPFDEITISVFDDKVAALNALKSGQLDAAEIEFGLIEESQASGLNVSGGVGGFIGFAIVDREGVNFPAFADVRVRQAIAYAFDREAINEELQYGYGTTSTQPFVPTSREYVDGGDDRYAYDPERARELLAEAGYPDGLTIQLPDTDSRYGAIDYRPVLEQYLGEVGITIEWVNLGSTPGEIGVQVAAIAVPADFGNMFYFNSIELFNTRVAWGTQPVSDPEFNDMIATYATGTPAEREQIQPILAEYILEQAWWIPVASPQVVWASEPGITVGPLVFPAVIMFQLAP